MKQPWVAIQRNPFSGTGSRNAELLELVRALREHGMRPRLFSRREKLDARLNDPRQRESLLCVVAAGGDGTIADILNRLPDVSIAILPLGTENLMAKYLGIPASGRKVAEMIAAGCKRRFDIFNLRSSLSTSGSEKNERRFFIMASLGFDADVINRLHASRKGNIRKLTYLQPIWQSLRKYKHSPMRLFFDDARDPVIARLTVLANLPLYAFGLPVVRSACGDDGVLDVRIFQPRSAFQMFRYFYKVACGVHERLADVTSVHAKRVRIESDERIPVQVDGDPAGWTPVEISLLPAALEIYVPPGENSNK